MTDNLEDKDQQNGDETPETDNSQGEEETQLDELTKERYKQIVEGSKQEVEKYKSIILKREEKNVEQDANRLLELHDEDPKLANEIAKKFGYKDFKAAKIAIELSSKQEDTSSKGINEDEFERLYEQRRAKEVHNDSLKKADSFITKSVKDKALQDKAKTYFDKITDGKKLDEESAIEFAEMATLYVNKDRLKDDKYFGGLDSLGSAGLSTSKKGGKEESSLVVRNGRLYNLSTNKYE